jgi:hypothetical protein
VDEYLDDLRSLVWREVAATARDPYRRALQRVHVARLSALLVDPPAPAAAPAGGGGGGGPQGGAPAFNVGASDLRALARNQLTDLRTSVRSAQARSTDRVAQAHLQDIAERITAALEPNR